MGVAGCRGVGEADGPTVTRCRESRVLAWTIPEAANALRMSENFLRILVRDGVVRAVTWNSLQLVPTVELERLIEEALGNGGQLPSPVPERPESAFLGVSEIAGLLRVPRPQVRGMIAEQGFPDPLETLSTGPIWNREAVEAWARKTGRL